MNRIGDISLRNIKVYEGHGFRAWREYENGWVLWNESSTPWSLSLGHPFRYLNGGQHPLSTGTHELSGIVTVPAMDMLFLRRAEGTLATSTLPM